MADHDLSRYMIMAIYVLIEYRCIAGVKEEGGCLFTTMDICYF